MEIMKKMMWLMMIVGVVSLFSGCGKKQADEKAQTIANQVLADVNKQLNPDKKIALDDIDLEVYKDQNNQYVARILVPQAKHSFYYSASDSQKVEKSNMSSENFQKELKKQKMENVYKVMNISF